MDALSMAEAIKAIRACGGEPLSVEMLAKLARMDALTAEIESSLSYLSALNEGTVQVTVRRHRKVVRVVDRNLSLGRSRVVGGM